MAKFRMSSISMPGHDIEATSAAEGAAQRTQDRNLGRKSGMSVRRQKRRFTACTTGVQRRSMVKGLIKVPTV